MRPRGAIPWTLDMRRDALGGVAWELGLETCDAELARQLSASRLHRGLEVTWEAGLNRYRVSGIAVTPAEATAICGGACPAGVLLDGDLAGRRPRAFLRVRVMSMQEMLA